MELRLRGVLRGKEGGREGQATRTASARTKGGPPAATHNECLGLRPHACPRGLRTLLRHRALRPRCLSRGLSPRGCASTPQSALLRHLGPFSCWRFIFIFIGVIIGDFARFPGHCYVVLLISWSSSPKTPTALGLPNFFSFCSWDFLITSGFLRDPSNSHPPSFFKTPPSRANRRHRTSDLGQILRNRETCRYKE